VDLHGLLVASVRDRTAGDTFDIGAFPAGERISGELVEPAAAAVRQQRRATARITALYTDDEPAKVSQQRVEAVQNALIVALDGNEYADQSGVLLARVRAGGRGNQPRCPTGADQSRPYPGTKPLGVRIDIATRPIPIRHGFGSRVRRDATHPFMVIMEASSDSGALAQGGRRARLHRRDDPPTACR
jgi:hypothetical protein